MLMRDCPCGLDHERRINDMTAKLIEVLNAAQATPCEAASALAMTRVNMFTCIPVEHHGDMASVELEIGLLHAAGKPPPTRRRRYDA